MTQFDKWEDAAVWTVDQIFDFHDSVGNDHLLAAIQYMPVLHFTDYEFISSGETGVLKSLIDFYLEICRDPSFEKEREHRVVESLFLLASSQAMRIFESKSDDSTLSFLNVEIMNRDYISSTVIKKQHDYGPNNIAKFGLYGIMIRLHDKIARLENLLSSTRSGNNAVGDETVFDTLTDVVGYSTVGIMWLNNHFLLPLSYSVKKP